MTDEQSADQPAAARAPAPAPRAPFHRSRRGAILFAATGALVLGVVVGGLGTAALGGRERATLVLQPAPVASLRDDSPAAVKGKVAEVFGNKLILDDGTGRVLIDTGREGDRNTLAAAGDTITAQGNFDRRVLRAEMLVQADGKVVSLKPPKPPHDGPLERRLAEIAGRPGR